MTIFFFSFFLCLFFYCLVSSSIYGSLVRELCQAFLELVNVVQQDHPAFPVPPTSIKRYIWTHHSCVCACYHQPKNTDACLSLNFLQTIIYMYLFIAQMKINNNHSLQQLLDTAKFWKASILLFHKVVLIYRVMQILMPIIGIYKL